MKYVLFTTASLAAIVSIATPGLTAPPAPAPATTPVTTNQPQFVPFGVDLAAMDKTVLPGDDFYSYVNGTWNRTTEIPVDRSSWGGFNILRDLSDQRTRAVIEDSAKTQNAPGSSGEKIGLAYAAFMDEAAIEAKGITPVKPQLDAIAAIATPSDLARMFGKDDRIGVTGPLGFDIEQDLKDNTIYAAWLGQSGLGLPDRDYYLKTDAKSAEIQTKYVAHIAALLRLAGQTDPDGAAKRIYALEHSLAQVHWSRAEERQVEKLYNPVATADLVKTMPGVDWAAWLSAVGLGGEKRVIVQQPSSVTATAKIIGETPITTWKEYLTYHTLASAAPLLTKAFVAEDFAFNGTVLSGTPQLKDRWKRGVDQVNGDLGEAVGELYVARYFPPEAKAKADELVRNITTAMDARLQRLTWMAPETKVKARIKLAAFTPKIGYPTKWRDYSTLNIVAGDAYGNSIRANEFEFQRNLNKIGKPVDRTEWGMTPQTVNAYANPPMNEIVFPAAILQPPFFDPNADPAVNYGAIGAVIGHEISHHFDDQGRKFDPKGNLNDWWTAADIARFKVLTDSVVKQYGEYEPVAGAHVNGELTLGENMADLAGLNVAYNAYHLSLHGKPAPIINGYTGDQRFFLGFGQVWRTKMREASIRKQITTDPHTPGNYRPYVARNLDAWYTAFNVKPGQKYYLAPKDRVKIW
ncbi:M13 family peptidase [Sphingomonas paeninsulae]|uniref:M13 family peptidase n=1 Tax=Sphingomonas paeninsulae TaxID=2319844 RepID=A0A494TBY4_SPHPE|nr:M13-type metalloendopeptidase [Sphingomonas paeninsulae]AYJ86927.1 M13 family peptidase [Sphingomonas paeninsulae]